jgi:anaerobic selenocysteine-containing dehydrogenase
MVTGDWIEITSDHAVIRAIAEQDETMRAGVVSMAHSFGGMPEDIDAAGYLEHGVSPNILVSTDRDVQSINAMPRMSGVPINIRRIESGAR